MKSFSPKQIAIVIGILSALIAGLFLGFSCMIHTQDLWKYMIIMVLSVFIVIYIVVNLFLHKFVIEKIKPIYKTIHSINVADGRLIENFEDKDMISVVKDEVIDWAKNKSQEIKKLKETEKYRKEFLGNVSHELKTPIFNIQGYILTLIDGGLEDPNVNKKYLAKAEKSIERLISIVEDLEAISKIESGELELKYESFDILKLAGEVFESIEIRAQTKGISLEFGNIFSDPVMVYADRQQIFQVLNNLVSNSINYGNEKGKTMIEIFDMDKHILVEVTDDGVGIPEESIPRIFERFYRVDKSRSRDQGGTGLGLAIVKHILEAHNQKINVRSRPGKGSSFAFTLDKA
ncbi:MAG: ATP-binding protein [Bacteroidota bacterium]